MNQKDNKSLFEQAMEGVIPLNIKKRAPNAPSKNTSTHYSPSIAAKTNISADNWVIPDHSDLIRAETELLYIKNSLPANLIRQLKRGQLIKEAELDLHGYTGAEAAAATEAFLSDCLQSNMRLVHIIHGKGASQSGSKLKAYVDYWLRAQDQVLAFCSAKPKDGGTGCLYVLLKRQ